MDEYRKYRRTAVAEIADWHPAFDMSRVSVSAADKDAGSPKIGDKVARNPSNHDDKWLIAVDYFSENFAPVARLSDEEIFNLAGGSDTENFTKKSVFTKTELLAFAHAIAARVQAGQQSDDPRLVSYAPDMSTCTLYIGDEQYLFDRHVEQPPAANAADVRDAERYRYLRQIDRCIEWENLLKCKWGTITTTETLDTAIDAAIRALKTAAPKGGE